MNRMTGLVGLLLSACLTACGVGGERTPEPSETGRIDALIQQLGVELTYDR